MASRQVFIRYQYIDAATDGPPISASLQASTSCSVNALDSQLLVAGDTITASSSTSLKLNAALQEWGQPGVEQPPPAVEAAEAPASEVPEDVDLPLGFPLDMFPVV